MDQIVAHLLGLFRVPVTKYGNPALAFVHSLLLLSNSCDKGSLHVQVVKDYHDQVKELYHICASGIWRPLKMGLELASKTSMSRAPCCRISQSVSGLPAFTFWVCSLNFDPLQVFQLFPPRTGNMDGSIQSRSWWPVQLWGLCHRARGCRVPWK